MTPFCFKRLHNAVLTCLLAGACLASIAQAQTYSVLYQFKSGNDGTFPSAGVAVDVKRIALYGTTFADGSFSAGTVFKFNNEGETVLHSFTGESGDGEYPYGNGTLVYDSAGNLYGTTQQGGIYGGQTCLMDGCGVVFKVDQFGDETDLYEFPGGSFGRTPQGPLAIDDAGASYGTTEYGGAYEDGLVFEIDAAGNEGQLHAFGGYPDGQQPVSGIVRDAVGNLYGSTQFGGPYGGGTIFKIAPNGGFLTLYGFGAVNLDGLWPASSVTLDAEGNVYGTTYAGGAGGYGTVFKVTPAGIESSLYNFSNPGPIYPYFCGVTLDHAGNIYGVTAGGGTYGLGTIYKLDPSGNLTILHNFSGPDGKVPYGNLALDPSGNLYGTTSQGGKFGGGVIFRIKP
jgi:uncharacterized repeat protein (TIGR03803 family)